MNIYSYNQPLYRSVNSYRSLHQKVAPDSFVKTTHICQAVRNSCATPIYLNTPTIHSALSYGKYTEDVALGGAWLRCSTMTCRISLNVILLRLFVYFRLRVYSEVPIYIYRCVNVCSSTSGVKIFRISSAELLAVLNYRIKFVRNVT